MTLASDLDKVITAWRIKSKRATAPSENPNRDSAGARDVGTRSGFNQKEMGLAGV